MSWTLDLTDVKETSFELIPEGEYTAQCVEAEIKETKAMTGEYINVKFVIQDAAQEGRHLFHMFNIKNDNPKAVEIGLSQLKTFIKCSGRPSMVLKNVQDLCGLAATVVVKKRTDAYGDKSVISYFKPLSSEPLKPKAVTPTAAKKSSPFS